MYTRTINQNYVYIYIYTQFYVYIYIYISKNDMARFQAHQTEHLQTHLVKHQLHCAIVLGTQIAPTVT